jgi:hypothetical protein
MKKNPTQKSLKIKSFLAARSCPQLKITLFLGHNCKNLRFFGQILHPQWVAQTPKTGQKRAFVL